MYVTKTHVFLHMNKCAGVFVKEMMKQMFPECEVAVYKHAPIRVCPSKHLGKRKIGVIRNPFDWYVSRYNFKKKMGQDRFSTFQSFMNYYMMAPHEMWTNRYKAPPCTSIGPFTYFFINFFCIDAIEILQNFNEGLDPNKTAFAKTTISVDRLLRFEHLNEEMIDEFGHKELLKDADRMNTCNHLPYQQFYTDKLRRMVEQKDSIILREFGYQFEEKR